MALQSQLFQGDPKLESAAVSDPAHILPGARGPHVGKIQESLIQLEAADIVQDSVYGPATAAAVLAFKQKRNIVGSSQTQADNIVGKLTMAALDREMLVKENAPGGSPLLGFKLDGKLLKSILLVGTHFGVDTNFPASAPLKNKRNEG